MVGFRRWKEVGALSEQAQLPKAMYVMDWI